MKLTASEKREQDALDKLHQTQDVRIEDNQFHMIALNLSGKRQALETRAQELIELHGIIKALNISNRKAQDE